jgi:hypothetical protein
VVSEVLSKGLAACSSLRCVDLSVSFDFSPEDMTPYAHDAWHCLTGILDNVPSTAQTVSLQLSAENWDADLEELDLDWQPMRGALKRFDKLQSVMLATVPTSEGSVWCFSDEEKELIARQLDTWDEKGVLRVE